MSLGPFFWGAPAAPAVEVLGTDHSQRNPQPVPRQHQALCRLRSACCSTVSMCWLCHPTSAVDVCDERHWEMSTCWQLD